MRKYARPAPSLFPTWKSPPRQRRVRKSSFPIPTIGLKPPLKSKGLPLNESTNYSTPRTNFATSVLIAVIITINKVAKPVYQWFDHILLHALDQPVHEVAFQKEPDHGLRVFPDGNLPSNARTESNFIADLIQSHKTQLANLDPTNDEALAKLQTHHRALPGGTACKWTGQCTMMPCRSSRCAWLR